MRLVVFLLLVIVGNGLSYALVIRPALVEREGLEARARELDQAIAVRRSDVAQWRRLAEIVELARPVLDRFPSSEGDGLSALRSAFVDAERGLSIQRLSLEFQPESNSPSGFYAFRVRVSERGDFADLRKYLERVAQLRAPIAPRSVSVVRDGSGSNSLRLNAVWYCLYPEESG